MPFLLSIVLLGLSAWVRLRLHESPAFARVETQMEAWLIREMTSWGFQQSLERQGLLHFRLVPPDRWQPDWIVEKYWPKELWREKDGKRD